MMNVFLFQIGVAFYEMLQAVDQHTKHLSFMDPICDFLYHIKYMFTGDSVKDQVTFTHRLSEQLVTIEENSQISKDDSHQNKIFSACNEWWCHWPDKLDQMQWLDFPVHRWNLQWVLTCDLSHFLSLSVCRWSGSSVRWGRRWDSVSASSLTSVRWSRQQPFPRWPPSLSRWAPRPRRLRAELERPVILCRCLSEVKTEEMTADTSRAFYFR